MQRGCIPVQGGLLRNYLHCSHALHKPLDAVTPCADWALMVRLVCKLGMICLVNGVWFWVERLHPHKLNEMPLFSLLSRIQSMEESCMINSHFLGFQDSGQEGISLFLLCHLR
jgi:hypothetical protein